jgi:hypothetical protein
MDPSVQGRRKRIPISRERIEMSETQFVSYYRCPYDGHEWVDV